MPKEYIDREMAMEIVKRTSGDYAAAWSEIRQLPAADVVPVVHGEWIVRFDGKYNQRRTYCPSCGKHSGIGGNKQKPPYCPNCGAKIRGGTE